MNKPARISISFVVFCFLLFAWSCEKDIKKEGYVSDGTQTRDSAIRNLSPVAIAGEDTLLTSIVPVEYVLDGSRSYDPDGSIVEYKWTKLSGPALDPALDESYQMKWKIGINKNGTYVFELKVIDNNVSKHKDTVAISFSGMDSDTSTLSDLKKLHMVKGKVVDWQTGKPLGGIRILYCPDATPWIDCKDWNETYSDVSGNFSFEAKLYRIYMDEPEQGKYWGSDPRKFLHRVEWNIDETALYNVYMGNPMPVITYYKEKTSENYNDVHYSDSLLVRAIPKFQIPVRIKILSNKTGMLGVGYRYTYTIQSDTYESRWPIFYDNYLSIHAGLDTVITVGVFGGMINQFAILDGWKPNPGCAGCDYDWDIPQYNHTTLYKQELKIPTPNAIDTVRINL